MEQKNAELPTIRAASPIDGGRIREIEAVSSPFPWSTDAIAGELSNPNGLNFVATAEDGLTLVGFILTAVVADELSIHNLATLPGARRRGVARSLLDTALDRARSRGAATAHLEVRSKNLPAIALYEKLGFRRVSVRKKYYRMDDDDALLMRKEL